MSGRHSFIPNIGHRFDSLIDYREQHLSMKYTFDDAESISAHDLAVLESSTSFEHISEVKKKSMGHMALLGAFNILIGYVSLFSRLRPEGSFTWFSSHQDFTKLSSDKYDTGHREKFAGRRGVTISGGKQGASLHVSLGSSKTQSSIM